MNLNVPTSGTVVDDDERFTIMFLLSKSSLILRTSGALK